MKFYFETPEVTKEIIEQTLDENYVQSVAQKLVAEHLSTIDDVDKLKKAKNQPSIPLKQLFWFMRLALTGQINGPGIHELISMLGIEESKNTHEVN